MSGILDSKSRVLDTVITTEGKRQLALGGIDVRYVSFSDAATFYKADLLSGSQDATKRIYLEACQLPQDEITFRADDDGNLRSFRNNSDVQSAGGRIISYSFNASTGSVISGSLQEGSSLVGTAFASAAETLLGSSIDNFKNMYLIASKDRIFEENGFAAGPTSVTFNITNDRPIKDPNQYVTHISALDSIFSDPRFSHLPNFKYLPPINKVVDDSIDRSDPAATSHLSLGFFHPAGRSDVKKLTHKQVMSELQYYESLGYMRVINFDPTSHDNSLIGQFFERTVNTLRKLDVIDYGKLRTGNIDSPFAHVFFVGKVEVDDKGTDTFLHVFTLVFE